MTLRKQVEPIGYAQVRMWTTSMATALLGSHVTTQKLARTKVNSFMTL